MELYKMKCDECSHEWYFDDNVINEQKFNLNNEEVTLSYFLCPKCKKLYKIVLMDKVYYDLVKELEFAKKELLKAFNDKNLFLAESLEGQISKCRRMIKLNNKKLNKDYQGEFIWNERRQCVEYKQI